MVQVEILQEWACAQVIHRLFRFLDESQFAAAAELFADNAVWTKRGTAIEGRAAIRASMEARAPTTATCHLINNLVFDPIDGAVRARYYVTTFADEAWQGGVAALSQPAIILACEDTLVNGPHGWRFIVRASRPIFMPRSA